ncbi:Vitamin B12 ABC transporter, B12-binding component BtuF [Candidatus Burkholderia verschuerenii]|uniref:Vitamin B12 ABC transporter, B12-binding component BtuF n=1 Tax=Candidatus Burkholderia verschuerenii TaxID=242163 RepID=A0A0L0MDT7_9BURK|nr:cobalamin-binding protein [Candidatus Burkholderia verschuerenii]KND60440.1 Vitamin B12 ABC transporter, B12-binding component BtuF [Candidatus Burkholderia verschuerenii]
MRLSIATAFAAMMTIASAAHAAITVTDDSGATVTLPAPAQRVVSLAPHVTELLFAAGGGARVVGAVSYSDYPKEAQTIPRVGNNKALDLERIVALHPDLIVVWRHGNADRQMERLRALGEPIFYSEPKHLADIAADLDKLGVLLGTSTQAHAAATKFSADIDALRAQYAQRPRVGVFYQVWDDPLMTLNGDNVFSEIIGVCGGTNVFAADKTRVPTISTEAVLAADPEAIVTATPGATPPDRPLPALDRWKRWPALKAVARDNLFGIDGDWINRPTPRLALGAARLCEDLDAARGRRPK